MPVSAPLVGITLGVVVAIIIALLLGVVGDEPWVRRGWVRLRSRLGHTLRVRWHPDEVSLLFMLLGRLAKSGGKVQTAHIQQARLEMEQLDLGDLQRRQAVTAFNTGKKMRCSWRWPLWRMRRKPQLAESWLRILWRMAWVDGVAHPAEIDLIRLWGGWMGVPGTQQERLMTEYAPQRTPTGRVTGLQAALSLLGVHMDTDPAEVKRAYRRLLSRCHPDKLAGRGASTHEIRQAAERTHEIKAAYTLIRNRRGFR